eukprot:669627-Rhodomonas_salina.4
MKNTGVRRGEDTEWSAQYKHPFAAKVVALLTNSDSELVLTFSSRPITTLQKGSQRKTAPNCSLAPSSVEAVAYAHIARAGSRSSTSSLSLFPISPLSSSDAGAAESGVLPQHAGDRQCPRRVS